MDRIGAWVWRRHREHFAGWLAAVISAMLVPALGVSATLVGAIYLGFSAEEIAIWATSVTLGVFLAVSLALRSLRGHLAPLRGWVAGDQSDPSAVWLALLHLPQKYAQRGFLIAVPLLLATTYPLALSFADRDLAQVVALALAYPYTAGAGALLIATTGALLVRPAAAEIAADVPAVDHIDAGSWPIRWRLLAVSVVTTMAGGLVMSALVLGGAATSGDYLLALLGSAGFGAYMGWVIDTGLVRPTLEPLKDVMGGTARVRRGDLTTPVPVTTLDELGDLVTAFNAMQRGLQERESLHAAFGTYVDPTLAQRIVESGSSMFEGEDLVVTVMFVDVRDFTSFSEGVSPGEAVAVLNQLFDVVVPLLREHGGHANHYLGDGLLAVFGAPLPLAHHATAAVTAAVAIQRSVRTTFGGRIRLGIGINTGEVIAGTVGGGGRLEFTVIGDAVNIASRVEQMTKEVGDDILLTEATRLALSMPHPTTTKRGDFQVRGRTNRITLHAVDPFPPPSP